MGKSSNPEFSIYAPGQVFQLQVTDTSAFLLSTFISTLSNLGPDNHVRTLSIEQNSVEYHFPIDAYIRVQFDSSKVNTEVVEQQHKVLTLFSHRGGGFSLNSDGFPIIPRGYLPHFKEDLKQYFPNDEEFTFSSLNEEDA